MEGDGEIVARGGRVCVVWSGGGGGGVNNGEQREGVEGGQFRVECDRMEMKKEIDRLMR